MNGSRWSLAFARVEGSKERDNSADMCGPTPADPGGVPGGSVAMDCTRLVRRRLAWLMALSAVMACGCQTVKTPEEKIANSNLPREFTMVLDARLRHRAPGPSKGGSP